MIYHQLDKNRKLQYTRTKQRGLNCVSCSCCCLGPRHLQKDENGNRCKCEEGDDNRTVSLQGRERGRKRKSISTGGNGQLNPKSAKPCTFHQDPLRAENIEKVQEMQTRRRRAHSLHPCVARTSSMPEYKSWVTRIFTSNVVGKPVAGSLEWMRAVVTSSCRRRFS